MDSPLLEDVASILFDGAVWPKLRKTISIHSVVTAIAYALWTLCRNDPAGVLSLNFLATGTLLTGLQCACLVAVLVVMSVPGESWGNGGSGEKGIRRVASASSLLVFTVLNAISVWSISKSGSWFGWLPGPICWLTLCIRPSPAVLFPLVTKPKLSAYKEILIKSACVGLISAMSVMILTRSYKDGLIWAVGLCVFLWRTGVHVLRLVIGEGHPFRLQCTGKSALPKALRSTNAVKQGLAFFDLCNISEERGVSCCRREEMFKSEGAEAQVVWNKIAKECLQEIRTLIAELETCVAREHGAVVRAMPVSLNRTQRKRVEEAGKHVRTHFEKISLCVRSLVGFCNASFYEDRTGIVRTGDPCLTEVIGALLEALVMLDNFVREEETQKNERDGRQVFLKSFRAWGSRLLGENRVESAALYFVFRGGVCSVANTFGMNFMKRALSSPDARPRHMNPPALTTGLIGAVGMEEST
ncbi:hypothetical protein BSKO_07276 [Bryopsis sp. KO-2023]|nr:hypothetical protein BSKO_07276 [Bryopsis sp. KO-2023]